MKNHRYSFTCVYTSALILNKYRTEAVKIALHQIVMLSQSAKRFFTNRRLFCVIEIVHIF